MHNVLEFMPGYKIGNEAIKYQLSSKLKPALIDAIHKLRSMGVFTNEAINSCGIMQSIKEHTGIDARVRIQNVDVRNACVYVPQLDRNNPILPNYMRGWQSNSDLETVLSFTNGRFDGVIDRAQSMVHGTFSKMSVPLYVTRGILEDASFSDAEIAAIIGHELGHVFTYFEYLIDLSSINYAAAYTAQQLMKTARDVDRVKLISAYEKAVDTKLTESETIIQSEDGNAVFVHLVADTVRNRRNVEGDELYSMRGFEFASDQFATRHGFGSELATGLAKIYQHYGHSSTYSMYTHILINVLGTILVLSSMILVAWSMGRLFSTILALTIIGNNPEYKIYDDPEQRLNRIRNEMVGSLKGADADARASIVANIAVIDETLEGVKDKYNVIELIWNYIIPSGRKAKKSREFQQDLEKLMNNDIFVSAAQLSTLRG